MDVICNVNLCAGNNIVSLPVELSRPFKFNKDTSDKQFVSALYHVDIHNKNESAVLTVQVFIFGLVQFYI